jgi:hypothetical protein
MMFSLKPLVISWQLSVDKFHNNFSVANKTRTYHTQMMVMVMHALYSTERPQKAPILPPAEVF